MYKRVRWHYIGATSGVGVCGGAVPVDVGIWFV